jgi:hypothetical protein
VAFLAAISACTFVLTRRLGPTAAPGLRVQITPAVSMLSLDQRGTDALATIDNPNPVPVDVIVRVRGFDMTDRAVIKTTIGPFRNVPAGGSRPIQAYLDATPLKSVTFEPIAVNPIDSAIQARGVSE